MADYRTGTGYRTQVKHQSACFSKSDPTKMYWVGNFKCGIGFNDYANWISLSGRNWLQNHKYDTALYDVDITTDKARRLGILENRYLFSLMWVEGEAEPVPPPQREQ